MLAQTDGSGIQDSRLRTFDNTNITIIIIASICRNAMQILLNAICMYFFTGAFFKLQLDIRSPFYLIWMNGQFYITAFYYNTAHDSTLMCVFI